MRRHGLTRGIDVTLRGAAALCTVSFAAFCLLTLAQVVNRYLGGIDLYWSEEVVILLFVWSVMLGLPVTLWWRQEIVVELLPPLPGRWRRLQVAATELCSIAFLGLLSLSGWQLIERAGQAMSPALSLPRWLFYACICVGPALAVLACLGRWWRDGSELPSHTGPEHAVDAHD